VVEMVKKGYKQTEEHKKKISLALKGKHFSLKTEFKKGHIISKETKKKMSLAKLGNKNPTKKLETRKKLSKTLKGKYKSKEHKRKLSETRKRLFKEGKLKPINKGKKFSKETKEKLSLSRKNQWQDPNSTYNTKEYREKNFKARLKGLIKRPTSLERNMIDIIKKHNLPYKYVGNGNFILGGKCPDFINVNGEKIAIEVFNSYWKIKDYKSTKNYKERRSNYFKKFGWKTIFINEDEIKNEQLVLNLIGVDKK